MYRIRCTFRPQAWVRDYATDVDPEGETRWEMEVDSLPPENSYESDALRESPNAPAWAREWLGPFEVDYEVYVDQFSAFMELGELKS